MGGRLFEAQFLLEISASLGSKLGDRPLLEHGSLIYFLRYIKKTAAIVIGALGAGTCSNISVLLNLPTGKCCMFLLSADFFSKSTF